MTQPGRRASGRIQSRPYDVLRWGHCVGTRASPGLHQADYSDQSETQSRLPRPVTQGASLHSVNSAQPQLRLLLGLYRFKKNLNMKPTYLLLGVAGTAAAILLDAAPSKAVLYIDFIPQSGSVTRIKASGSLDPSLLGLSSVFNTATAPSGPSTSAFNKAVDSLRFTYSSTASSSIAGKRYAIGPGPDPFVGGGNFPFLGPTSTPPGAIPMNNPPLMLRLGTTKDVWLPDSFTGGAVDGFFDVDLTLSQIFGATSPSTFAFTSGSEKIFVRRNPNVPGPVPLLGAAAAFGYSRKLRNRIQKSTPSRTA